MQIVRERMSTQEFAAKFFMSRSAFEAEAQLYLHESPLKQFMPHVRAMHDNADKQLVDLRGVPLPPCIVMEKGESLDIFCDRSKPDQAQAYSVCPPGHCHASFILGAHVALCRLCMSAIHCHAHCPMT